MREHSRYLCWHDGVWCDDLFLFFSSYYCFKLEILLSFLLYRSVRRAVTATPKWSFLWSHCCSSATQVSYTPNKYKSYRSSSLWNTISVLITVDILLYFSTQKYKLVCFCLVSCSLYSLSDNNSMTYGQLFQCYVWFINVWAINTVYFCMQ